MNTNLSLYQFFQKYLFHAVSFKDKPQNYNVLSFKKLSEVFYSYYFVQYNTSKDLFYTMVISGTSN